jgi:hypothetical protein
MDQSPYQDALEHPVVPIRVTGDAIVHRGPCLLWGIILTNDSGAAEASAVYDNVQATGRPVISLRNAGAQNSLAMTFPKPIRFYIGIFWDTDGLGNAEYTFLVEPLPR